MKLSLLFLLIPQVAIAGEVLNCPETIEIEEKLVQKTSFQLFKKEHAQEKLQFSGLHVFDGHPREQAQLKPDNGDDTLPHFWTLRGKQFWAACSYGIQQKYFLIRHLKPVKNSCRMAKFKLQDKSFNSLKCQ